MAVGGFGATREEVLKTGFFLWFCLEDSCRDGVWTRYRPQSPQLGPLVAVDFDFDEGDHIRAARICVERRFIEDPTQYASAADITKSFLLQGASEADLADIDRVAAQIFGYRPADAQATIIRRAGNGPPAATGPESAEYQVYCGRRGHAARSLKTLRLICDNRGAVFVAQWQPLGIARTGWLGRLLGQ